MEGISVHVKTKPPKMFPSERQFAREARVIPKEVFPPLVLSRYNLYIWGLRGSNCCSRKIYEPFSTFFFLLLPVSGFSVIFSFPPPPFPPTREEQTPSDGPHCFQRCPFKNPMKLLFSFKWSIWAFRWFKYVRKCVSRHQLGRSWTDFVL